MIPRYFKLVTIKAVAGLTGALPDDRNSSPQGYRHGDTQNGEFFRLVGTRLRHEFFLDAGFPTGECRDWFATPKPAHMRFSDQCLVRIVEIEFRKACNVWDVNGCLLPVPLLCHSGGTQCGVVMLWK